MMFLNLIFRPVELKDLVQLYDLTQFSKVGLSSLPRDKGILKEKIKLSLQSFEKKSDFFNGDYYLFVLEDIVLNKVVGLSAILSSVGSKQPFLSFDLSSVSTRSKQLKMDSSYQILSLNQEFNGPSELLTLFLHPNYRGSGVGRFLSLARFLFIKHHQLRFKKSIIAEIRGHIDQYGNSLFYDSIIKPFLKIKFFYADQLSQKNNSFLTELLPKFPIVVDSLSFSLKQHLFQPHALSLFAMKILQSEGFKSTISMDVLDAGPKIYALLEDVRVFSDIKFFDQFKILDVLNNKIPFMVATGTLKQFKVCMTHVDDYSTLAILDSPSFRQCLKNGNSFSYVRLFPKSRQSKLYNVPISYQKRSFKSSFLKEFSSWYQGHLNTKTNVDLSK